MLFRSLAQRRRENLLDIGEERWPIHRAVDDIGRSTFRGELFHYVHYSANISIEDDEMLNTIEHQLSGRADLVAEITLVLPLSNPKDIKIEDVWYSDGLELQVPLKY